MERSPSRTPVITDVARRAGVSAMTVSRFLRDSERVSPQRRVQIMAAIEELGYRPNGAARALVSGRQSLIAVLASDTMKYGYASTIKGIEEVARNAGFIVMITVIDAPEPSVVSKAVDLALSHPVSGVIVLKFDPQGAATLRRLPDALPVVAASGSRGTGVPHAVLDDTAGAARATEYLLGLGHDTVHYLAVPTSGRRSGRAAGWRKALQRAGAEVPPTFAAGWDPHHAYEIGLEIAKRRDVTAVLCGNDELAMGLLRAFHQRKVRVPDDISVVGFDGHPLSELCTPALTTVEQDFVDLGRRSFELLHESLEGRQPTRTSSASPRLVIRESAGPPRH
jgi:DNA-binding LacI/PurR family transcriptional regulator